MTSPNKFELIDQVPENIDQVLIPYFEGSTLESTWVSTEEVRGFDGEKGDVYSIWDNQNKQSILLMGLGKQSALSTANQIFLSCMVNMRKQLKTPLLIDLRNLPDTLIYQCVLGISLAEYSVGAFKTEKQESPSLQQIQILITSTSDKLKQTSIEAQHTAEVVKRITALVDAPGNIKTPDYLAQWALRSGKEFGYSVEVLRVEELKKQNLQAILAVGRGSEHEPLLIKTSYQGNADNGMVDLGLVGKGVTFDTGGISIKKATNMHYMKSDMGGAAAVMGAMELIARLKLPLNAVAVIPVAENSVDASSIRPGDVIQSHAGKSIEVIDTDAEGRLILADGLSYIQKNYQPQVLIDLATLTGSCVAALGYEAAGLFTQNQELAEALSHAGDRTGEQVWRLPLWDNYRDALHSDIADVKNLSGKPVAGAITAAKFLEYFVEGQQKWAHLDIAGVAFGDTAYAKSKSATGYGVRLLVDFAKALIST